MSIHFKLTVDQDKKGLTKRLNNLKSKTGLKKGELLEDMISLKEREINESSDKYGFISYDDQEFIKLINTQLGCYFIHKEGNYFWCYEKMSDKVKRPHNLGKNKNIIYNKCMDCQRGKWEKYYNKMREKGLFRIIEAFKKIMKKGMEFQLHFCDEGYSLKISRDDKTFACPLNNYKIVDIEKECKIRINPDTGKPPCKYYTTIPKRFKEGSFKEYEEIIKGVEELPSPEEVIKNRKFVDVETEEIEKQ